ncbi:MAG: hypothetical protein LBU41_05205 [Clostridiales Family XIII bacterium]|nr:hypothetical protein [Clostridiales Family XIII bacterium]
MVDTDDDEDFEDAEAGAFRRTCSLPISEAEIDAYTKRVMTVAKAMEADGFDLPTKFEALTAIAFLWFAEKKPDFVVLEVGLGGREDSTNVIDHPLVSVITSISKDHTAQLGDSIDEIAAEKAGIIKEGCPVVCGAGAEGKRGIAKRAYACSAPLLDVDRIYKRVHEKAASGSRFSAVIRGVRYEDIYLSMGGGHQIANALCALATIEVLRKTYKVSFSMDEVRHGMAQARVEGRFEIVSKSPLVIFDGAHNAAGAAALADAAEELLSGKRILLLTGIQADKDSVAMLQEFLRFADGLILTESSNPYALPAAQFLEKAAQVMHDSGKQRPVEMIGNREVAYVTAKQQLADYDCLIVAGSLYLLGDYIRATI